MRNYSLKSKADYLALTERLEEQKLELLKSQRGTEEFKKALKRFIELTLFVKAHSYCLDNETERKKVTNVIFTSLLDLDVLS